MEWDEYRAKKAHLDEVRAQHTALTKEIRELHGREDDLDFLCQNLYQSYTTAQQAWWAANDALQAAIRRGDDDPKMMDSAQTLYEAKSAAEDAYLPVFDELSRIRQRLRRVSPEHDRLARILERIQGLQPPCEPEIDAEHLIAQREA